MKVPSRPLSPSLPLSPGRRDALKMAGGALLFPLAVARSARAAGEADEYTVLSLAEARFLEAAADRIVPPDEGWPERGYPGGRDAGCVAFIDAELAGPYGDGASWYRAGPFATGTPSQGWQLPLTPRELYAHAITTIDAAAVADGEAPFVERDAAGQDAYLARLEEGIDLDGVPSGTFFTELLANVKEGLFADPLYSGNRDMVGWRMVAFPGARGQWRELVGVHDYVHDEPPVAIGGTHGHGDHDMRDEG